MRHRPSVLKRWLQFCAVGALGVLVQLGALAALAGWLGCNYLLATACAVETAVLHNFAWHERWTWAFAREGGRGRALGRLIRFHGTNGVVSLLGNVALMGWFVGTLGMNREIANLAAIALCGALNFASCDRLVFAPGPAGTEAGVKPSFHGGRYARK